MTAPARSTSARQVLVAAVTLAVVVTLLPATPRPAQSAPVAADPATYQLCGRVFPDPHAYWPLPAQLPLQSPWAKGNVTCRAATFLSFDQTVAGLEFLASDQMFGDFIELYDLSDPAGPFADALDLDAGDGSSAGLPQPDGSRDQSPMLLIRVTDEQDTSISIDERERFVYALSIHGIERAGVEGGVRAIEDLATWASCEKHGDDASPANCAQEGAAPDSPHPLLETLPERSIGAGDALRQSTVWFVLSNPDGWRRGDLEDGGLAFQRYNGNGMDLNRDWPAIGNTYRPYTPLSEPENRTTARALRDISTDWTGGIDLHGQLIDRAFSFTLIGGSERPFDKDRRVLQFVQGAYQDAENRLAWSPVIKPNDAPPACVEPGTSGIINPPPDCDPTSRMYGVQYGTIWDTIAYTVTGALGDWMDSEIGLNGDAIDNEMSLSHLSNCVTGNCYLTEFEQLHVDGNKSLIYGMIHYSLLPEDTDFRYRGKVGYIANPRVLSDPGTDLAVDPLDDLPRQDDLVGQSMLHDGNQATFEFDVDGPADGVSNGGLYAEVTFTNVGGVSGSSLGEVAIDRRVEPGDEPPVNPAGGDPNWEEVSSYFNQAPTYLQAGARIDVNAPPPGRYRLRTSGGIPGQISFDLRFTDGLAWPDPGQRPFEVSNQDLFDMLAEHVQSPLQLEAIDPDDLLAGRVDLDRFDTILAVDDAFVPGYRDPDEDDRIQDVPPVQDVFLDPYPSDNVDTRVTAYDAGDRDRMAQVLRGFAAAGGNLVLTDDSLRALEWMGLVADGTVGEEAVYAGHVQFTTDAAEGSDETYDDPLAANIDLAGAAEGPNHRHQTTEPVPLGYAIQTTGNADADTMPEWGVDQGEWESAGGRTVGTLSSGKTVLGEVAVGEGQVRIAGSLVPFPTDLYDHPYGLASYGLTYTGYEVLRNLLDHDRVPLLQEPRPDARPGIERRGGADRIATAIELSRTFPSADTVVLARADDFADALAGGPLAGVEDAPLLLTPSDGLHDDVAEEIRRLGADRVLLLGGGNALSPTVESDVAALGVEVDRIFGPDRFDTAVEVSRHVGGDEYWLATGRRSGDPFRAWPDAVTAGGIASVFEQPILLTDGDGLPAATADRIAEAEPALVTLVGGEGAILPAVEDAVGALGPLTNRLGGRDRYETSIAVVRHAIGLGVPSDRLYVTTGRNWPDALGAAAAVSRDQAVLLLVPETPDPGPTRDWLEERTFEQITVAGGPAAVSEAWYDVLATRLE